MVYQKLLRTRSIIAVTALGFAATGCNIHPLPENVSRASTYDIVARVRCEVQEALDQLRNEIDPSERAHAERIIKLSVIGIDFNFDISEGNNIKNPEDNKPGASLAYQRPSHKDIEKGLSLKFTGSAERERTNVRRFRIVENLGELERSARRCGNATKQPNWIYPVTGATGMGEVVSTYIKLELLTDIARKQQIKLPEPFEDDKFDVQGKSIAFSDVLRFTTRLSAGVNPQLTLTTVAGDLRVTDAFLFGSVHRDDIHSVIVALASDTDDLDALPRPRPPPPPVPPPTPPPSNGFPHPLPKAAGPRDGTRDARGSPGGPLRTLTQARTLQQNQRAAVARAVVREPRTATALVQRDVNARTNVLMELQRLRDLEDDVREEPRRLGERLLKLLREPD